LILTSCERKENTYYQLKR